MAARDFQGVADDLQVKSSTPCKGSREMSFFFASDPDSLLQAFHFHGLATQKPFQLANLLFHGLLFGLVENILLFVDCAELPLGHALSPRIELCWMNTILAG